MPLFRSAMQVKSALRGLRPGFVNNNSLDLMFVPMDLTREGLGVGWSVYREGERAPERIYMERWKFRWR
jgi:hypothetical protein